MLAGPTPGPAGSRLFRARKAASPAGERSLLEIRPADGADRARCLDELRKLRRIRSPHVPAIVDAFDCAERSSVCLVTDPLGGKTLRELIGTGPGSLEIDRLVPILIAMFDALGGAHGAADESRRPTPIVHGDLRPEHVAMVPSGRALVLKVVGFGLGQVVPGVPAPTVPYAAPEVLRGERPTPASDVYSAGVIAWELLAGRHPFANTQGVLPPAAALATKMQSTEVPPLPEAALAVVPPSLADLLVELCALDPALRPTAPSVRVRLTHALNPLAWARARLARVRRPQTSRGWIGALLVALILGGGGAIAYGYLRNGRLELPWKLGESAPAPVAPVRHRPPVPVAPPPPPAVDASTAPPPIDNPTVLLVGGITRLVGVGDRRTIAAALRRRLPALQTCYERRLAEAPTITGEMSVAFLVTPAGGLSGVDVGRNTTEDGALAFCVQGQLAGVRVLPAPGTEAQAWATFSFGSGEPPAPSP